MYNTLQEDLENNINNIKMDFNNTSDLSIREIKFGTNKILKLNAVYLDGLVDTDYLQNSVILRIIETFNINKPLINKELINNVANSILSTASIKITNSYQDVLDAIIQGKTVLIFDGFLEVIIADTAKWKERALEESSGERTPNGMVFGFSENAQTNLNVLRGIIKSEQFCVEKMNFGSIAKTDVYLLFLHETVDNGILKEVTKRLEKVDVKYIMQGRVVQEIVEGKQTFFPLTLNSERPDVAASGILEGRVVLMVDGNPQIMIFPSMFTDFLQAPDEYTTNYGRFSIRIIRLLAFLTTIFLPGIYVALDKYGSDRLSNKVYESLVTKNELLPTLWEVIILIILFRIVLDACNRIPKNMVILIALIGPILIGETAITANLIHPVGLIIIGLTFITGTLFGNSGLTAAFSTLRYLMIILAYFFGYSGIIIGSTFLLIHMVGLRSIGVPYLSPLIPFRFKEIKDSLYRGDLEKSFNSKHSYPDDNN
ncbi:spore germination protein [Peribacillus muralis]|uniref:spore germination protein n=1 Tax=Peribacillus muralis TaxID=264697 RepID=UPI00070A66DE|nr:spore germination protein [Peribacillus muralis]